MQDLLAGARRPRGVPGDAPSASDGRLDIVTGHSSDASVDVILGAKGGLGKRKTYSLHEPARSVAIGDFDKDGRLDIMTSTPRLLDLVLGEDGGFGEPGYVALNFNTGAVRVADLDKNGWLDNVIVDYEYWALYELYGSQGLKYPDQYRIELKSQPSDLVLADINRDGWLDRIVSSSNANRIYFIQSLGPQSSYDAGGFATGVSPWGLQTGDFDGDEWLDVVVANMGSDNVSVLLSQQKNGRWDGFADQLLFPVGKRPGAVAVGDINGDGRPDVVVANESPDAPPGTVSVLLNRGGTPFEGFDEQLEFIVGSGPRDIALADFDGDGWLDVVTANHDSDNLSLLRSKVAPECVNP